MAPRTRPLVARVQHVVFIIGALLVAAFLFGLVAHALWAAIKFFVVVFLLAAAVVALAEWRVRVWWKSHVDKE